MKQQRRRSRLTGSAILVVAALLLAACGGDGDDNASTGNDDNTTTTFEDTTETTDTTVATEDTTPGTETTIDGSGTTLPGGTPTTIAGRTTTTARGSRSTTTVKRGGATTTTTKSTNTTVDQGQPKNITGVEVPAGQAIKIGVQGLVGADEFTGNLKEMYEVALANLRKAGKVPVNGRDIVLYFRGSDAFAQDAAAAQRGACTALAQDDKVFAAVTYVNAVAATCLASDFKIPAISGVASRQQLDQAFPYLFAMTSDPDRVLRNLPVWADSLNLLKGQKLGLYHGTAVGRQRQIDENFKPSLRKAGYTLTEEATSNAAGATGTDPASDRVAVQRFKAAGVQSIFFMASQPGEFAKAAQAQGYHPKYIYGSVENSFVCGGCPARLGVPGNLVDGSHALAGGRFVEDGLNGNPPPPKEGVECAQAYEKASGVRVRQTGTSSEQQRYQSVQWSCDQLLALVTALEAAGPKLTQGALINALETSIKGQKSGFISDITFTRTNHFGSNDIRTLRLQGDCVCWKAIGGLREPFVA